MLDGFLELSDFAESLTMQESASLVDGRCFFDVQYYDGKLLGYCNYLNLNENCFLLSVQELAMTFRKPESVALYMNEEEHRIAVYGDPVAEVTLPNLLPACDTILTAYEFIQFSAKFKTIKLFASIGDGLYVIRVVLEFHVTENAIPVSEIESILQKAIEKSRVSRDKPYY